MWVNNIFEQINHFFNLQLLLQGKRVQKCVETLDELKVSNGRIKPVVVTTKWETFDHPPSSTTWELFD